MSSNEFVSSVVDVLADILKSETEVYRLGLTPDIADGWLGYVTEYDRAKMIERVRKVAAGNKVPLDTYEADHNAKAAAEMLLGTVDGFYRHALTRPN